METRDAAFEPIRS